VRGHVDLRLTDAEDFGRRRFGGARCSAENRADASDQFTNAEGLGDVIIGAGIEAPDFIDLLASRREDDDRDKRIETTEFFANLEAVRVGQHQIEEHGFGFFLLGEQHAACASARRHHGKPFELECIRQAQDDVRFVFDDEDFFLRRHLRRPVLPQNRTGPEEGPVAIWFGRQRIRRGSAAGVTRAGDEERRARLRFAFADEPDDALLVVRALGNDFRVTRGRRGRRIDVTPTADRLTTDERRVGLVVLARVAGFARRLRDLAEAIPLRVLVELVELRLFDGLVFVGVLEDVRTSLVRIARAALALRIARFEDEARHVAFTIRNERTGQALTTERRLQAIDDGADGGTVAEVRRVFALVAELRRTNGCDDALRTEVTENREGTQTRIRLCANLERRAVHVVRVGLAERVVVCLGGTIARRQVAVGAVTLGAGQEREDARVLQVVVRDRPFVTVDGVAKGHRRIDQRIARDGVRPRSTLLERLDHERIERLHVFEWVAEDDIPGRRAARIDFGAELGGIFEALLQVVLVTRDVLPGHTDDTGEEDQAVVADARVVVLRIEVREDRVGHEVTGAIRYRGVRERLDVAVGRIEEVDAETTLLIPATQVDVVFGIRQKRRSRTAVRIFAGRIFWTTSSALTARLAARIVGILGAFLTSSRQTHRRRAVAQLTDVIELAKLFDRAVVFVRQHDDREQRIGTHELSALLQEHHVGARRNGLEVVDDDRVVRIGIREETVNGFELRLVTTTDLARTDDHVAQRGNDTHGAVFNDGFAAVFVRRIPREELLVHERGRFLAAALIEARKQVTLVVVRRVGVRRAFLRSRIDARARVGAMAADAGARHADVNVENRFELAVCPGWTHVRGIRGLHLRRSAVVVEAARVDETLHEVGDGEREDLLLVGHRTGVVDAEHEVDFVDGALLKFFDDGDGQTGFDGIDGSVETTHGTRCRRRRDHGEGRAGRALPEEALWTL
jgi:hypothetical protein